jgi:hypothetical protein
MLDLDGIPAATDPCFFTRECDRSPKRIRAGEVSILSVTRIQRGDDDETGDQLCVLQSGGVRGVADAPNVRFTPLRQHAAARFDGPQRVEVV